MGLDTVELVIAVEEEFQIEISDADAAKLGVLGDLHDYIVQAIRRRGETPDEPQIWERLKTVVVAQLGVSPDEVVRSAHVVKDLLAD